MLRGGCLTDLCWGNLHCVKLTRGMSSLYWTSHSKGCPSTDQQTTQPPALLRLDSYKSIFNGRVCIGKGAGKSVRSLFDGGFLKVSG